MPFKVIPGIYKITNVVNGKIYVGSAKSYLSRISNHKFLLKRNRHFNNHLQSSWNKHGFSQFKFELIEECSFDSLQEREEFWISHFNSNKRQLGYNKRIDCKTNLGIRASDITRERLRLSHLGYKRSKSARKSIARCRYKKVCQIDKTGRLIKTFNSILFAEKHTGTYKQGISACCRKVLNIANGFHWCFKSDFKNFQLPEIKKRTGGWINGIREKRIKRS